MGVGIATKVLAGTEMPSAIMNWFAIICLYLKLGKLNQNQAFKQNPQTMTIKTSLNDFNQPRIK